MATNEAFLERAAQFHFERIHSLRKTQLEVEETVVDAFETECVVELIVHADLGAGKPCHRRDRHSCYSPVLVESSCSKSGYCASGSSAAMSAGESGASINCNW